MSKLFEYTSVFAPFINDFIHEKELQGCKATQLKWMLLEFDRFFTQTSKNELFISSDDVKNWATTRTCDNPNTLYQKYCAMADFCRFMCLLGYECYIPKDPKSALPIIRPLSLHMSKCGVFSMFVTT